MMMQNKSSLLIDANNLYQQRASRQAPPHIYSPNYFVGVDKSENIEQH